MNSDLITEINSSKTAPLFGFWYPACLSSELAPCSLKGTVLLGLPILVCKTSQGAVAAMRDICPHRGMPLSFGKMEGDCVECAYHGWQFDQAGRCRKIPALVQNSPIQVDKIGITTYACRERDGYVWVFVPDPQQPNQTIPDVLPLPLPSSPYRMIHYSTTLQCSIDDGVIGLLDPAHGPFVHQSPYWRSPRGSHEKTKSYEPIPSGFRMTTHAPSRNSTPYKLLRLVSRGDLTTTIDFVLPNQRFELLQCGVIWVSMRAIVTPLTEQECRIDFSAAWNFIRWVPFVTPLFRFFARIFLNQDKQAMEQQTIGLRYKPPMMLVGDADTPTKWYLKLKAAHLASVQTGQPLDHPLKERVTLHWKS
jgi:phenylpropionate dioxygenase-like ring-hydroxylating dioxygenase large terminal subunit